MTETTGGNGAVRSGVMVGLILAVFSGIVTALYDFGIVPSAVQAVEFLLVLVGFFIVGMRGSKATGRTVSGLLSGLIAGLFVGIVIPGANVVMALVAPTTFAKTFGYHDLSSGALVAAALVQALGGLILWAVFGLIVGVLGGLVGRRQAIVQPVPTSVSQ